MPRLDPPPITTPIEGAVIPNSGGAVQTYISKSLVWSKWLASFVTFVQSITTISSLEGTHADRPDPTTLPDATPYYETDRTVSYIVIYAVPGDATSAFWQYTSGEMVVTLFPDTKPTDLGVNDLGFKIHAKVRYNHYFLWDGAVWYRSPGDYGRYPQFFELIPTTPGWVAADGSTQRVSNDNATTSLISVPSLPDGTYLRAGAYTGDVNPKTAPTATGTGTGSASGTIGVTISGDTGSAGAHVHTFTPAGGVTGNMPQHHHTFTPTGDIGGYGLLGDHTHGFPSANLDTGGALTGAGGAWSISGDIVVSIDGMSMSAVLPQHLHGLSGLTGDTTGNENQSHDHTVDGTVDTVTSTQGAALGGSPSFAVVYGSIGASFSGVVTYGENQTHNHNLEIGENGRTTDYNDAGTDVPVTFVSGSASGSFSDTSADHKHEFNLNGTFTSGVHEANVHIDLTNATFVGDLADTSGVVGSPIALSLTFAGDLGSTSSDGAHTHAVGTLAGSFAASGITISVTVGVTVHDDFEEQNVTFYQMYRL